MFGGKLVREMLGMRTLFLILLVLLAFCGAAWAKDRVLIRQPQCITSDKAVPLSEAIDLALQNLPTIRQAAAQVVVQTGGVKRARSALFPTVDVTSSAAVAGNRNNIGTTISETITQLIYDFGRSRYLLDQSRRQESAAQYNLNVATLDAIFTVKQDYYSALRTARLVQVFEANLKAQEAHVAQAQARLDAGLAPRADVLKAQAAAASARVDLITARNNADQARADVNVAIGVDVRSTFPLSETSEPEFPVPDLNAAVILAAKNRPEMCQAIESAAAIVAALKAARTGHRPSVSASFGESQVFGSNVFSQNSFNLLLNLNWTPFDSGLTAGEIMQAQGELESAEEQIFTVQQTVSRDVVAARLNLLTAQESLVSAQAEVASATENVNVATGRYKAGIGIFLEVLDAQALLLKAQVDEATALYGLSTARAQLEHAIGCRNIEGTLK